MAKFIKANYNYIFIFVVAIIICMPLASSKINIYQDDGVQHVCRLIGTAQTLESKEILPNIMPKLCNNFGYSWNIFYSPLTAYLPLIFKFCLSYVNSLKLFMFFVTFASGITMYQFTLKITKNKNTATLAAVFYVLSPYRITDMYIRVAIAELASFVFVPIVFNGMYTILNEGKKSYILAWGTIALLLTHTVITMYTAILCFIYLMVFIKKLSKQTFINLVVNLLLIITITSFFWVGLLQHYLATSYEVFAPGRMINEEKLEYLKTKFYQLFYTPQDEPMIYAIGLVIVAGLVLSPVAWKKLNKEYKKVYILFLAMGVGLTIMTFTFFPFEKLPQFLKMIQFTFRLFEFTSFFYAFVAAVNYGMIIKEFKVADICILSLISVLLLIPYWSKLNFDIDKNKEQDLIQGINVTEYTGRVHAGMASMEYLPSKAFNVLRTYVATRKDEPIILDNGEGTVEDYYKDGTNMSCKITNINGKVKLELPYIYYLGYRIYLNGSPIEYQESENGFVQITINNIEEVEITVKYTGTNAMIFATIISAITFLGLVIAEIMKKKTCKLA